MAKKSERCCLGLSPIECAAVPTSQCTGLEVKNIGGNVVAVQSGGRWRVRIDWEDGESMLSDQDFASKSDAIAHFKTWAASVGANTEPTH